MITIKQSWKPIRAQAKGDRPIRRTRKLMTGNSKYKGTKQPMDVMNNLLGPKRRIIFVKKNPWNTPFMIPNVPIQYPMVDGGKPKPPSSVGVA